MQIACGSRLRGVPYATRGLGWVDKGYVGSGDGNGGSLAWVQGVAVGAGVRSKEVKSRHVVEGGISSFFNPVKR